MIRSAMLLIALCLPLFAGGCFFNAGDDDSDHGGCVKNCDDAQTTCTLDCDKNDQSCTAGCDTDHSACTKDCS